MVDIESELEHILEVLDKAVRDGLISEDLRKEFEDYASTVIEAIRQCLIHQIVRETVYLGQVVEDIELAAKRREVARELEKFIFVLAHYAAEQFDKCAVRVERPG